MMHLQGVTFQAGVQYLMLLLKLTPHIFTFALGPSCSLVLYLANAQLRRAGELTCLGQPCPLGDMELMDQCPYLKADNSKKHLGHFSGSLDGIELRCPWGQL